MFVGIQSVALFDFFEGKCWDMNENVSKKNWGVTVQN